MTAAEREQIRAIVEQTCASQGIPLAVPPEIAQAVAAILRSSLRTSSREVAPDAAA